ncbi:hypothetical protein [Achromobacter aegrifaciens]|uniref:hypothetical protein n=1 Tax=Achromobacter aegrifaciens TaxID=1287736 RepID=UPI000F7469E6|nr:hypothetical protein [Achromobacter aegrifaciens]RSF08818.1 hypothetical protein EGU54_02220 [Achromobacter aegrifaciens]
MGIKTAALAAALSIGMAGCSTTPVSADKAKPVPKERLYGFQQQPAESFGTAVVTRDSGFTGSACYVLLRIDGVKAAEFGTAETATFYLKPGDSIMEIDSGICGGGNKEIEVKSLAGESRRYRIFLDSTSGYGLSRTTY